MSEVEAKEAEVGALRTEANAHREDVWNALDQFVQSYDAAEKAFRPVAHELRLAGEKPQRLCPRWVERMVSYYRRRDTMDAVNR